MMDAIPIGILFAITLLLELVAVAAGCRLGYFVLRRSKDEKESPASAIAGSILGLLAFILAFTFGTVTDRYEARKALVREEATVIHTTFLRSDFLPEPDRSLAAKLLLDYASLRLDFVRTGNMEGLHAALDQTALVQRTLWDMAVAQARRDMNSDVAALYIESLNRLVELNEMRVTIGVQTRVPAGIWLVLYILMILGMTAIGYQATIAGSRRSWTMPFLWLSFAVVIALVISMDRPGSHFITVSQQPIEDIRDAMARDLAARATP